MARTQPQYLYSHFDGKRPVMVHRDIAEKAYGKKLPLGAIVHHADADPYNNENTNLVICPNEAYHNLLHLRLKAFAASGNPSWLKCYVCKEYDAPENVNNLRAYGKATATYYHVLCVRKYQQRRRAIKRGEIV